MNPSFPPSKTNSPAWQSEHAQRLHFICKAMAKRLQNGDSLIRCVRRFGKIWNGKAYQCDPSRNFRLSKTTLYRVFAQWKHGGELPAAVALRFTPGVVKITEPMMRSFVRHLISPAGGRTVRAYRQMKELRERKPYSLGSTRPMPSYSAFLRHLPPGAGRKIVEARKAVVVAEIALAKLCLAIEAHAANSVPPRVPRKQRPQEFEI